MWNNKRSVILSLTVCTAVAVLLVLALVFAPWLINLYFTEYRGADDKTAVSSIRTTVLDCFYPSAVFAALALYALTRMLLNILRGEIFVRPNISSLRLLSWCCFAVALITFIGGFSYVVFFLITAAAGFMGLVLRVVKNVMQAALELREENDLTI